MKRIGSLSIAAFALLPLCHGAQFMLGSRALTPPSGTPAASVPTLNPGAGTYGSATTVTISTTSGVVICYNTAGSPATDGATGCTTGTLINTNSGTSCVGSSSVCGDITVSSSETVYAVAGGTGYADSSIASAAYSIVPIPTVFNAICGQYPTTTFGPIDTTGAKAIVVVVGAHYGGTAAPTDNMGNGSATALTLYNSNGYDGQIFYWATPTVGTGHTFTLSAYTGAVCIVPIKTITGVFDTGSDVGVNGTGATTCQTPSMNPGTGTHIVIAGLAGAGVTTPTINSSYSVDVSISNSGGNMGAGVAHLVQTPNGSSTQPTWTVGSNGYPICELASFH